MSILKNAKRDTYALRAYINGRITHLATYGSLESAKKADEYYKKTGMISEKGRKISLTNKGSSQYMGNYTEKYYAKVLKKERDNPNSFYNQHMRRRYEPYNDKAN